MEHVDKWYQKTTYVDVDTGEIINKNDIKKHKYYKIKTVKTYEFTEQIRNGRIFRIGTKINTILAKCYSQCTLNL